MDARVARFDMDFASVAHCAAIEIYPLARLIRSSASCVCPHSRLIWALEMARSAFISMRSAMSAALPGMSAHRQPDGHDEQHGRCEDRNVKSYIKQRDPLLTRALHCVTHKMMAMAREVSATAPPRAIREAEIVNRTALLVFVRSSDFIGFSDGW